MSYPSLDIVEISVDDLLIGSNNMSTENTFSSGRSITLNLKKMQESTRLSNLKMVSFKLAIANLVLIVL